MARNRSNGAVPVSLAALVAVFVMAKVPGCTEKFAALSDRLNNGSVPEFNMPDVETPDVDLGDPSAIPTTAPTEPTAATTGVAPADIAAVLAALPTAPYDTAAAAAYDREQWPHWNDIDGDRCDARQQALKLSSTTPAQVDLPCQVIAGDWYSIYDGFVFTDPSELDTDHIVPLKAAQASGAGSWTTEQREAFANDQFNLWAVSASSNRSKSDKSPDQWRPGACAKSAPGFCDGKPTATFKSATFTTELWCTYATRWIEIKAKYGLSVTDRERSALTEMIGTCG